MWQTVLLVWGGVIVAAALLAGRALKNMNSGEPPKAPPLVCATCDEPIRLEVVLYNGAQKRAQAIYGHVHPVRDLDHAAKSK